MSTVILAEKPSQALAYASALKQSTKKDGYFAMKSTNEKDVENSIDSNNLIWYIYLDIKINIVGGN
nr:hypothetical protein [Lactococcus lactis]